MAFPPAGAAAPALPEGRFSGPAEFSQLLRLALAQAAARGWREMLWCDPDFGDWPLGERAVAQALNDWSGSGGRLTLLAGHYGVVLKRHARFVAWRQTWAHRVECRKSAAASAGRLPSALWAPGWVLERLDVPRCTGVAGADPGRRLALKEHFQAHLSASSAGFPATVLGL